MRSLLSIPPFPVDQRPRPEEVDLYAAAILRHENCPDQAWARCRQEAELQLWAMRSFQLVSPKGNLRNPPMSLSLE